MTSIWQALHSPLANIIAGVVAVWCFLQLKASTDFLRQAHPLKHVAPVRKSQVQHALCEVLAAMLADNVKADMPRYVHHPDPILLQHQKYCANATDERGSCLSLHVLACCSPAMVSKLAS